MPASLIIPASLRRPGIIGALTLLAMLAVLASLAFGSSRLSAGQVWDTLFHSGSAPEDLHAIIFGVRIPRTILGVIVGVCLGVAGTLMQGHTRNPLADPGIFGVSAGAGLAVVIGVFVFGVTGNAFTVVFAVVGALIASVAVFGITAAGSEPASPVPMALAGAAVSALLDALTSFIVLADRDALEAYRLWVVGSLSGRPTGVAVAVLPFAAAGLLLAVLNTRALDNLSLGTEMARGLGENVLVARVVGLAAITLLTAAATAAAGPVGFVGLVVPHLARPLVGAGHRWLLPASALLGISLVLGADVVGRMIGGTGEVQVGIVLAVLGGPFFVAVARRRSLAAL
ncbi:iron complex transport system permease protein [Actinoplanes tereljensis]|uniref:Iron ABC transporter permease n=1 Tax=Paractinoplanes tereljensis TaxID=571912 RepID=A0A919NP61_9ACTN|nr:iron ABC transporter permease [Actinoplanes tereljensis]GIF21705.1 iron ABC transporter permease [Actinoplanes tereljensis]